MGGSGGGGGRGGGGFIIFFFLLILVNFFSPSISLPLCTDSRAPFEPRTPLAFCPYNGTVCCNSTNDLWFRNQVQAMNISDSGCASLLKSIVCSKCDQFSADLFRVNSIPRQVPVLCNSTVSLNSSNSNQTNFCTEVWNTCQNVSIRNSPFAQTPINSSSTRLADLWPSKSDFCNAFGGDSVCFDGEPIKFNATENPTPPSGMCIEQIGNGSYLNMVPHPDGSSRAFFSDQPGKIYLATIPKVGSGGTLDLDVSNPFLDLTDEVHFDTEFGMMGIAFHPGFARNGRFFASFNCDKAKWTECSGRCSCNSNVNCDPSKLGNDNGSPPCQYQTVIAEFTTNGTASQASSASIANPSEVRRIFTMGLPFRAHHGGQILFGPDDGFLYFMMGDGGSSGDPYNFAQNKKSLLGKIMRLDVDNIPSAADISRLGLWGNYSVPTDNPYTDDEELQPEIWALGLRNPWRCSFDSSRPSYFMCADVGQDEYEEVDIITKDGNYGWRVYEGFDRYTPPESPGGNTSVNSIRPIFPVMGYNHSEVNKREGSASITGGYFYRSMTDPCMFGKYLFADLYAGGVWAGTETPENSGNFTTAQISFKCAQDSPINCTLVPQTSIPSLGYIFSFGEDNKNDVFLLASSGVYRIVPPSRCNYACSRENATATITPSSSPPPPPTPSSSSLPIKTLFCSVFLILLVLV